MTRSLGGAAWLLGLGVSTVSGQTRTLVGRVTDSLTAAPVSPGQVVVLRTRLRGSIQPDGSFALSAPVREVTLEVQASGYRRAEVVVPATRDRIAIALAPGDAGGETAADAGSAIGGDPRHAGRDGRRVNSEQLRRAPARSVAEALAGRVTGVDVSGGAAGPGAAMQMRLRGVSSLLGGGEPLFVVDGIILSGPPPSLSSAAPGARGTIGTPRTPAMSPIAHLNPGDIESVEILKGAAAGAMYGSRASHGVVIITTKQGRLRPTAPPGRAHPRP